MHKLLLTVFLLFVISVAYPQPAFLAFKKKNKSLNTYWKGSIISFQLHNGQWQKGFITGIQNDSFSVRPFVVQYHLMGTDTQYFNTVHYALSDVYAMPKKGVLISFKNGSYNISRAGGHVHWYWIKSGWIFRVGAIGYTGLHLANGAINKELSFSESRTKLGLAAAVFLGGMLLKKTYRPTLRINNKYRLKIITLSR